MWKCREPIIKSNWENQSGFLDHGALELGFEWISWMLIGREETEQERSSRGRAGSRKCQQHAKAREWAGMLEHSLWMNVVAGGRKVDGGLEDHGSDLDLLHPFRVSRGKQSNGFKNGPENQEMSKQKGGWGDAQLVSVTDEEEIQLLLRVFVSFSFPQTREQDQS